jgi:hypothetical protein
MSLRNALTVEVNDYEISCAAMESMISVEAKSISFCDVPSHSEISNEIVAAYNLHKCRDAMNPLEIENAFELLDICVVAEISIVCVYFDFFYYPSLHHFVKEVFYRESAEIFVANQSLVFSNDVEICLFAYINLFVQAFDRISVVVKANERDFCAKH